MTKYQQKTIKQIHIYIHISIHICFTCVYLCVYVDTSVHAFFANMPKTLACATPDKRFSSLNPKPSWRLCMFTVSTSNQEKPFLSRNARDVKEDENHKHTFPISKPRAC